uniref:Uncharacterized protein n=1 Tax=Serinus canaria TaxID=9135 RepID=A0A8C9N427_SERCA
QSVSCQGLQGKPTPAPSNHHTTSPGQGRAPLCWDGNSGICSAVNPCPSTSETVLSPVQSVSFLQSSPTASLLFSFQTANQWPFRLWVEPNQLCSLLQAWLPVFFFHIISQGILPSLFSPAVGARAEEGE